MEQLYPPWANRVFRGFLVGSALVVVGVPTLLMIWFRTPYGTGQNVPLGQPLPFNHLHHAGDDGIDCEYCHYSVMRAEAAGVPPTSLCMNCHSQIWNDATMLTLVWQSYRAASPIPWNRVHRLPDFVFFHHAVHVRNGVGCETCHGRVDRMPRVYQLQPLTMGWCLECHRNPAPNLRPREAVTVMGWQPGPRADQLGAELQRLYGVAPRTDCYACHR